MGWKNLKKIFQVTFTGCSPNKIKRYLSYIQKSILLKKLLVERVEYMA